MMAVSPPEGGGGGTLEDDAMVGASCKAVGMTTSAKESCHPL
jgi:hypothetical protein